MDRGRVTPSISESDDFQDANAGIKRDREHITDLNSATRRFFANAIDPDASFRNESRSI
jgi:hypothetical protein